MDDLAVGVDDDQFAGADFDDRGAVLVDVIFAACDASAEQGELAVRSDVADDLDVAPGG